MIIVILKSMLTWILTFGLATVLLRYVFNLINNSEAITILVITGILCAIFTIISVANCRTSTKP